MNPCETDSVFITALIRTALLLLTSAMIRYQKQEKGKTPTAVSAGDVFHPSLGMRIGKSRRQTFLLSPAIISATRASASVPFCVGLCFPGRAFDSLCCEVSLRSRRCVGED